MTLAGDVGGTKTHLALYAAGTPVKQPVLDCILPSQDAASLEEMIDRFLAEAPARPSRAVLGIAGPVVGNRSNTTNLPWDASGDDLSHHLGGIPVTLMNDLVATAYGLEALREEDIDTLSEGIAHDGNRALIAAGTGLGEALLVRDGDRWITAPSEGGHSDFAPQNALQDELCTWLRSRYGHVSNEHILSGRGFADIYRFLGETGRASEPDGFAEAFSRAEDPAVVVTDAATDRSCERAVLAAETFVHIYGAEAGNVALRGLSVAGLYVGGGIAPRLRSYFHGSHFMDGFLAKGRARGLLEDMPVKLILDPQTALWGAATFALETPRT